MLTCWCQERQVKYKQGLNEVFELFVTFVRDYTPFFSSEEFVPLQCAFIFFRRLLLYHRPDLHNLFVEKDVCGPEFCMPWFLTLFASKTPMRLAIQLWDRLLERGEPHFIIFLAVLALAEKARSVNSREDLESTPGMSSGRCRVMWARVAGRACRGARVSPARFRNWPGFRKPGLRKPGEC
ncbi:tbc1d23 [Symbiodinium natans]|uniref:Tbc1d23 protein n=1 Tax=Symbiodinium natans TaxID=878477 RepID=A0A812QK11_9DINO|nr:tbc1d23 [Symbiodinium natans]